MMALHWTTAALIVTVVVLSWVFPHRPARETSIELLLHRSFGLVILALTLLRLIVGRVTVAPEEEAGVPWVEAAAARVTHWLLYAILLAMPVTGFLWTAAQGYAVDVFGLLFMNRFL
jgi:cytochrome b561